MEFLGFSSEASTQIDALRKFSSREWKGCLPWLSDAGIALYFLQKLKNADATDVLPGAVLDNLELKFHANQERTEYFASQFRIINQAFDRSGVGYAVVKGFSLAPQFCPDIFLRSFGDLDYLVDRESVPAARTMIEQSGYSLQSSTETEFKFLGPPFHIPGCGVRGSLAIEMHLSLWSPELHRVSLAEPQFSRSRITTQAWQGLIFPGLPTEDVFVLQAIHAFHHILTCWIRMSWLYEIGYFLSRRADDVLLWTRIRDRIGEDPVLREAVALIAELAGRFFSVPLPSMVAEWSREIRPPVRVWIENYARTWAFGKNHPGDLGLFPTAKLVLFLHQQYVSDKKELLRKRLLPVASLPEITATMKKSPMIVRDSGWQRRRFMMRRTYFHLAGGLRYLCEIPRWRRLNKKIVREARA